MIAIVRTCKECPMCTQIGDSLHCNISTPKHRKITTGDERPTFCLLRREQVIVREFQ